MKCLQFGNSVVLWLQFIIGVVVVLSSISVVVIVVVVVVVVVITGEVVRRHLRHGDVEQIQWSIADWVVSNDVLLIERLSLQIVSHPPVPYTGWPS